MRETQRGTASSNSRSQAALCQQYSANLSLTVHLRKLSRGDETVGNPYRAQIYRLELFEFILLLKLDKQLPVEQLEATLSQSTVPSTPLT